MKDQRRLGFWLIRIVLDDGGAKQRSKGDGRQRAAIDNGASGHFGMKCFLLWFLVAGWWLVPGCGDSGRSSIEGVVTLDGQPLPSGSITFVPLAGTKSPTAGAEIVDGKFSVAAQRGTFAGKFRVEITASRPTGKKVPHPGIGGLVDEYSQYLLPRYNTASELQVEVQAGAANQLELSLLSR